MQRKYFGTDGIRGRVNTENMNADFMLRLGKAFGYLLSKNKNAHVLIGHDTRESCAMLESSLQAGLATSGIDVKRLGVLPTPAIAHLTHSLGSSAGIVISASHNSFEDNGIKFFDQNGMKISDEMELAIEAELDNPADKIPKRTGTIKTLDDAAGRYSEYCKSIFPSQINLRDLKIIIDCANGANYDVAPNIFSELGAQVTAIHNEPDGKNINKKCGATDLTSLIKAVKKQKADLGFAFDGDGDRLMMVDHHGEVVDGDEILCILAKDRSAGLGSRSGVVGTVMSNLGLEQALKNSGIAFERAAVGDRYVLEALVKNNWVLGGEASGHIVDLDYTTTGDGIITALQVLRIIRVSEKSLHELKQVMVKRPQILINVPVSKTVNLNDYPELTRAIQQMEASFKDEGRVLLRPSGTEPVIRVMVEGNDETKVKMAAKS